jgi:transketolase
MIDQAIEPAAPPDAAVRDLVRQAAEVRLQIVRAMGPSKFHHFGGSLSAADLLVALYHYKLRIRPDEPGWPDRDRFILSKGHSVPAQYVCMARRGFFPLETLATLKTLGSILQGHPDMRKTPGLEANTGSLGMGLSAANGLALAGRVRGASYRVYVLLGDGECQEGQVWEAAMTAGQYHLDTVTAIVDRNGLQAMGRTEDRMSVEPLAAKWQAFGWNTLEIDGHDMGAIRAALDTAAATPGRPTAIIARTVKGKGVPSLENQVSSHNAMMTPDQYDEAVRVLEASLAALESAR